MTRLVMHKMSTHSMSDIAREWFQNHGREARRRRALERQNNDPNWVEISPYGEEEVLDGYGKKGSIN